MRRGAQVGSSGSVWVSVIPHIGSSLSLSLYFLFRKIIGLIPDSPLHRTISGIQPDKGRGHALKRKEEFTDATWHLAWKEKIPGLYMTDFCIIHETSGN